MLFAEYFESDSDNEVIFDSDTDPDYVVSNDRLTLLLIEMLTFLYSEWPLDWVYQPVNVTVMNLYKTGGFVSIPDSIQ